MSVVLKRQIELADRYGISTFEPFFDLSARRHLMPSVMDSVPTLAQRCACPGGTSAVQCILPFADTDHLCIPCRDGCFTEKDGKQVSFIELHGPAYHFARQQVINFTVAEDTVSLSDDVDTSQEV